MTYQEANELQWEQLRAISEKYKCDCSDKLVVRRRIADGRIMVCEQCRRCGRSPRTLKKADYKVDLLPWFDDALNNQFHDAKQQEYEQVRAQYNTNIEQAKADADKAKQIESLQWWQKYNQYLRSQQWHEIRKRVLERDGNLCQACLKNKATQVHHLSYSLYEQVGRSAAFELIAICQRCHETIHPHMADTQGRLAENLYSPYLNGSQNAYR